jgi:hypothetical protein
MDKRGDTSLAMDSIMYLIICALVFIALLWFVNSYEKGSAFYEDFYAKEIVGAINSAKPGMELKVDISNIAEIALENGKSVGSIVAVDNVNNLITVSSRLNSGTSFGFFNDVDIVDFRVELPGGNSQTTQFIFRVKENQKR